MPDKKDLANLLMNDYGNITNYFGIQGTVQPLGIYIVLTKPDKFKSGRCHPTFMLYRHTH